MFSGQNLGALIEETSPSKTLNSKPRSLKNHDRGRLPLIPNMAWFFWEPSSLPFSPLMIRSQNFITVSKPKNSPEKHTAPALEKGLDILEFLSDFSGRIEQSGRSQGARALLE